MVSPLKAYLQRMKPDGRTSVGPRLPVMFNPTDFSISKGAQLAEVNIPGLAAPVQQFVRLQAAKLTVRLFFDSTDQDMGSLAHGVVTQTDAFYDLIHVDGTTHAPPVVRFVWGSSFPSSDLPSSPRQRDPHFVGVVESVQQEFSLFSPRGIPLRATLTLVLREYKTLQVQREQLGLSSPDRTHAHVVVRGETLSAIAEQVYGDPTAWRPIAEENGVDDPRRLRAGTVLVVPPLPRDALPLAPAGAAATGVAG